MNDYVYDGELWAVINPDGTFAGVPCHSWEEARELANAREGRVIWGLVPDPNGEAILEDDQTLEDDALSFDDFYNVDMMDLNP